MMKNLEILLIYMGNYNQLLVWLLMVAILIYVGWDKVSFLFKGLKKLARRRNRF